MPLSKKNVEESRRRKSEIYSKISIFLANHAVEEKYYCAEEIANELKILEKEITEQLNELFRNLSYSGSTVYSPSQKCELMIDIEEKNGISYYAFIKIKSGED